MADKSTTLSVFTADVGGLVGHVSSHPEVVDNARERLSSAKDKGVISDYHVLKLYAWSRGLLDEFSGNLRCLGPGVAELEFIERSSEPVVVFLANKTSTGAWNLP